MLKAYRQLCKYVVHLRKFYLPWKLFYARSGNVLVHLLSILETLGRSAAGGVLVTGCQCWGGRAGGKEFITSVYEP